MTKRYIFHYDKCFPDSMEVDEETGMSANDILTEHDGMECNAEDVSNMSKKESVEIFFDDGNEFTAFVYELEKVRELKS